MGVIRLLPKDLFISSGFLQTLAQSLGFMTENNPSLITLIKYLRKLILSTREQNYVGVFCESGGLANLFDILNQSPESAPLRDLILTVFTDLSEFDEFKRFVANDENYLQALWRLVQNFDQVEAIDKILAVLENIVGEIAEASLSLNLEHLIEKIKKK
jgi:hypothetical protein